MQILPSEAAELIRSRSVTLINELELYENDAIGFNEVELDKALDSLVDAIVLAEYVTLRHKRDERYYGNYRFATEETPGQI
jgi:hypothetical protein